MNRRETPTIQILFVIFSILLMTSCSSDKERAEKELLKLIKAYEQDTYPLQKKTRDSFWLSVSGTNPELYDETLRLRKDFTSTLFNRDKFSRLQELKSTKLIEDIYLKQQLDILYNIYSISNFDIDKLNRILDIENFIYKKTQQRTLSYKGEDFAPVEVKEVINTTQDLSELEVLWRINRESGLQLKDSLLELVELRNELAVAMGYSDYYTMKLKIAGFDPAVLDSLYNVLHFKFKDDFSIYKDRIDRELSGNLGVRIEEIKPWHYRNLLSNDMSMPISREISMAYKGKDLEKIVATFYAGLGLEIDDVLTKSALYCKNRIDDEAYCFSLGDRDIYICCNLRDDILSMSTLLHNTAQAAYHKNIPKSLPILLRSPASPSIYEGVSILFGRLAFNTLWMQNVGILTQSQSVKLKNAAECLLSTQSVINNMWMQVIYRFERELYKNPEQDLNILWWSLINKYQKLNIPEGREAEADWAMVPQIITRPCYSHNYVLGEVYASQLENKLKETLPTEVSEGKLAFANNTEIGNYLKNNLFRYGDCLPMYELIYRSTGERITLDYYIDQVKRKNQCRQLF